MVRLAKRLAVLAVAGTLTATSLTGCGTINTDETVATVGDEKITLGVANFYARLQQAQYETYYASMMGTTAEEMWAKEVSDNQTYEEQTKKSILENLENMYLVSQHASDYDVALTEEEQTRLIEFIYQSKTYCRLGPLFTVLLGTGMRIGEALGLRWCDCDFKKELISVNHTIIYRPSETSGYKYRISEPKTKAGLRVIPMLSDVKKALLSEKRKRRRPDSEPFSIGEYTGFIFLNSKGKVFTPAYVFDSIQHITSTYNREEYFKAQEENREPVYLPKFSAHILRHTFCTRLCENERNLKIIQDVMGHRNIRTTMDVYNEATESKKLESFSSLDGKIKLM